MRAKRVLRPINQSKDFRHNFLANKTKKPEILDRYYVNHRGLKLDGAIGQGEICNSLKSENFSKSFLSHIGKNKIKF